MKRRLPGDKLIWRALRPILRVPFIKRYNLYGIGMEKLPRPPFILIGNHAYFIDAVLIEALTSFPIVWAVAAGNFDNPFSGPILRAAGAIQKRKGVPDIPAMRKMIEVVSNGGVLGLMPEGSVTWDGEFGEVPPGTDRFLEKLNVPVVAARMSGAYLTKPRWADHHRWGRIEVEFKAFNGKEALDFLSEASDWRWQEEKKVMFKGRNKAEGIEKIIWFCEKCGGFQTIKASGDSAICDKCGTSLTVDDYGLVSGRTVPEIIGIQREILAEHIALNGGIEVGEGTVTEMEIGSGAKTSYAGRVSMNSRELRIGERSYLLPKIRGLSNFLKRITEFNYEHSIVRLMTGSSSLLLFWAHRYFSHPHGS